MNARRFVPALACAAALTASPALAQADRSAPPKPGPVRPLRLPPVEKLALSSGLPVLLVPMHEVPVVEVLLVVRAGAVADPAGREGLAQMTADMLDEGAGGKDALALADAMDFLGAQLETEASWDASTVRLRVPVARLADALPVMADVAIRPDFPESELARLRKEALTDLLQARDEPERVASPALYQAVFGPAHRYGRPEGGDAPSIAALTAVDLRAFHAARYGPASATLVVAGDVTAEILPQLEKAFGSWRAKSAAAPAPAVPAPVTLKGRTVWLVDKPGAAQSAIRVGGVGPSWSAPGYPAAEVMNTLLGGSFTSRLNDNLREQHGYAYGAASRFQRFRTGGLFFADSDVQTDKTAPAVTEFVKELTRIRTPATPEEVERARRYAALGYAGDFETTAQMARRMADRVLYGLPDGFFEEFVPKALATDVASLQAAARALVDPGRLAFVVVGDGKTVEAPLRALGLGSVRTLTVEDVMGPAPKVDE
jgi:predicted Zn-dependent peptidase